MQLYISAITDSDEIHMSQDELQTNKIAYSTRTNSSWTFYWDKVKSSLLLLEFDFLSTKNSSQTLYKDKL